MTMSDPIWPSFFGERRVSLIPCTFARYVAHGYSWLATCLLWSSSKYSWRIVDSIQTAWRKIPQEHIQALTNSMSRILVALIAAHRDFTSCWIITVRDHEEFYKNHYCCTFMYLIGGTNFTSVICILFGIASFTHSRVHIVYIVQIEIKWFNVTLNKSFHLYEYVTRNWKSGLGLVSTASQWYKTGTFLNDEKWLNEF